MINRIIGRVVTGLGGLMAVGVIVPMATGALPDYARFSPAPTSVEWVQDDDRETALWLETNLVGVELRISGLDNAASDPEPALGIGSISQETEAGGVMAVGHAGGCQDGYHVALDDGVIPADTSDDTPAHTPFWLEAGSIVGIVVCEDTAANAAAVDGVIALYTGAAPGGELLTSYDITGRTKANSMVNIPPSFSAENGSVDYLVRRVCVDNNSSRDLYFDGGENVGAAVAASDAGQVGATLTYSLAPAGDSQDFALFNIGSGTGQITVSEAGADDHSGLDDTRLFTLTVVAEDDAGASASTHVTVQVVKNPTSTGGDGSCS